MFNVKIIKLKDIIKIVVISIFCYVFFYLYINSNNFKEISSKKISINTKYFLELAINQESGIIKNITKEKSEEEITEDVDVDRKNKFIEKVLNIGLTAFKVEEKEESETEIAEEQNTEELNNKQNSSSENIEQTNGEQNDSEQTSGEQTTEVVTQNPIAENYNKEYNGIKIKNETSYDLTDDIFNTETLNINTNNILIFHTHTCESYTQTENSKYEESGNFRTTDLNYSVARVGDELTINLQNLGFNVLHNKTYHDYPAYTGSYKKSLSTVQEELKDFNSDIIIDLHRDAIGSKSNYAPTVKIGDDYCAQLMFVMGTDGGGLSHQNWRENLKFAIKVQQKANEMYPGLFKAIVLRNSRYNQHLGKAACIIEVGATGNTLEQANCSMKYLAKVLADVI